MDPIAEKLAGFPLLANLTHEQRQRLSRACECIFVAPGKTLIGQGQTADAAYLCLDDTIVSESLSEGEPEVASVPANSIILELAMIVEAEATARFVAEGHARVLKICRHKLLPLLEGDPALAQVMSETLSERLNDVAGSMREAIASFPEPQTDGLDQDATDPPPLSPDQASDGDVEDERRSA